MAYLGREAGTGIAATAQRQTFVGDGSTNFTLSRSIADSNPNFLEVFVSNVQQEPVLTYSVSGTTLTFTTAPDVGEPIYVIYRDYKAFNFGTVPDGTISQAKMQSDSIGGAQLLNDTVTTAKIADGNVTIAKMADGTFPVNAANIGINAITHVKVAADAIGTPQIKDGEVTIAKLAPGTIPVINAANIENNAVETAKIQDDAVTNLKISPNIVLRGTTTFMGAAIEKANIIASNVGSTGEVIDIDNQDNGVIFFTGNSYSNSAYTVNFINMDHIEVGNAASFVVMLTNNLDHQANINAVQINGDASNNFFFSGGLPVTGSANIDVYSFSVLKTGTSAYTTIASLTNFT